MIKIENKEYKGKTTGPFLHVAMHYDENDNLVDETLVLALIVEVETKENFFSYLDIECDLNNINNIVEILDKKISDLTLYKILTDTIDKEFGEEEGWMKFSKNEDGFYLNLEIKDSVDISIKNLPFKNFYFQYDENISEEENKLFMNKFINNKCIVENDKIIINVQ